MNASHPRKALLITAWAAILLVSLFKIVLQEIFHIPVSENLQYSVHALVALAGLALAFAWKPVRPLRAFFALLLALAAIQWLVLVRINRLPVIQSWLDNPSFNVYMLAEQSLKLVVTLLMIAFLLLIGKKRSDFFLSKGNTSAPVEPIRWLGVKAGTLWSTFGRILAICLSLGTLTFLVIAGTPLLDILVKVIPFVPAVLLAAVLNAFYEEVTYKASFLSVLEGPAGKGQALLLMAAFFGLWHYYGVPYGIVGVLMAGLLGWLLGKSMLETRGLWWAWFLHFLQDVLIFLFLAIGSIKAGG